MTAHRSADAFAEARLLVAATCDVQAGEAAGIAQLAAVMMPNAQIAPAGVADSDRLADRVLP